jgi:hypothetical protein
MVRVVLALVIAVVFAGCGVGGSTGAPHPAPTPTPSLSPIVATPSSLTFAALGAAAAQTVTLSEAGYEGAFSLRTACTIVTPAVLTETSYSITPLANGACTLTFFDANGQSINVPVTVSATAPTPAPSTSPTAGPTAMPTSGPTTAPTSSPSPSPIVANPVSFAFLGTGAGLSQTLTLSEAGYTGTFALTTGCAQIAVTPSTGTTFALVPASAGSCGLVFGDNHGQTILVPAIVTVTNGSGE